MFRFTIRDLLWLMAVVAVACGWWLEYHRSPTRQIEFRAAALEEAIKGHGFTVEYPSPFRVKVWNPRSVVIINHEPSSLPVDPFGPATPAPESNPFGPASPLPETDPFAPQSSR